MTTPITQLLRDTIKAFGPADPGIVRLEQDSPEVGNAVLLLFLGERGLAVRSAGIAASIRQNDAVGALKQLLDFLWGHLCWWFEFGQHTAPPRCCRCQLQLQVELCNLNDGNRRQQVSLNPGVWVRMRDNQPNRP